MSYTPQLTMPKVGDPYYNKKPAGYNPCILGNPKTRIRGLNVLPNCVGYGVARYNAVGNYGYCKWLGNTNAANFIDLAKKQGLQISAKPTLGGVMVWKGGQGSYGHIAVVESILAEDTIVTSESEYYGKAFVVYKRKRGDGNWRRGCYWMTEAYKYAGCIVNPAVKEEHDLTKAETEKLIRELVPEIIAELAAQTAKMDPDDWALPAIDYCKEHGLMVGDKDGNFRAQSPVRREELAIVAKALDE